MFPLEFHVQLSQNDGWSMSRLHFHDLFELMLPLTSSGNIFVNDQVYPLQRGRLYFIGENILHRTMVDGFHSRYVLHISRNALSQLSTPQTDLLQFTRDSFRWVALDDERFQSLASAFEHLSRNINDGSFGGDLRQTIALAEILIQAAPLLQMANTGDSVHSKDFLRIVPILDYIQEHLTEPLTLDQIASKFFISKHYLCRIFKTATGFSVMEYIIHSRILRARQLLQTGVTVQQAGELSGFSDNSHFIRTFGNLTGTSPGRYAKEYRGSERVTMARR